MAKITSTRLRAIRSKDLELLLAGVNNLNHKVEIKGNPVKQKSFWYLFFVLPDDDVPALKKVPLIVNLD